LEWILFKDHIVGEILGFGYLKLFPFYIKITTGGGKLEYLITLLGDFRGGERNKGADTGGRGNERHELGVKELDGISLSRKEGVDDLLGNSQGLLGVRVLSAVIDFADGVITTLEVGGSLLSDEDHVALDSLSLKLSETGLGLLDHEGVVSSAKTTISGDDDKGDLVDLTLGEKGKVSGLTSKTLDESSEDGLKGLGEGTGGHNGVLGTTDLSGSHQLHGRGNLFGVVYRGNTVTDGVGLSVSNDGGTTSSVGSRGENIVEGGGGGGGGESSRVGGESLGSGNSPAAPKLYILLVHLIFYSTQ
jgi:hypothetical protein